MKNEKEELNNVADKLASEIEEEGKLGFEDIDNEAQALLGVTPDKYEDEQICMLNMRGINTNFVTGDFYTDEYEKEHPEVAEDYNEKSEEEDIEESEEI